MNETLNNPSNPKLDALLDEALTDVEAPQGLAGRIFEQTRGQLPASRQRDVIVRIGPPWVRALAAAVILAASAGVIYVGGGIAVEVRDVKLSRGDVAALSSYETPTADIDSEIGALDAEIDLVLAGGMWNARQDVLDEFDEFQQSFGDFNSTATF